MPRRPCKRLRWWLLFDWIGPFTSREQLANTLTAIIEAVGYRVLRVGTVTES
jgi:hypothetical protein